MLDKDKGLFEALPIKELHALCIWTEAADQPMRGKLAIGCVVYNRAQHGIDHPGWGQVYGDTVQSIILSKNQFSAFNSNNSEYPKLVSAAKAFNTAYRADMSLVECLAVAKLCEEKHLVGEKMCIPCLFYETTDSLGLWNQFKTKYGREPKVFAIIGKHRFYDEYTF